MPVIPPSNTTLPIGQTLPGSEGNRPSSKRSIVFRSLNRVRNLFRTGHCVSSGKALSSPPKTVSVDIGRSVTLEGGNSTLSTTNLSYCSALAVLSRWNGSTFDMRTLMHLTGSSLSQGLFGEDIDKLFDALKPSLADGAKVIWVGGLDAQTDFALRMSLEQERGGRQPLLELLETPGVSTIIAGASGVKVMADGSFTLEKNIGRGVLSEQEVRGLCHVA
jgi:hypothetical protein